MASQLQVENLNTEGARLPAAYEAAKTALTNCASIDECQSWANKAQALASYARQADDDALEKHAVRIRSRAVRRCGELLREFNAPGARTDQPTDATVSRLPDPAGNGADADTVSAGAPPPPRSAADAARAAGMSERQHVTAIRVANVPADRFELAVDSDEPPTITRLADMGRRPVRDDEPAPPGFQAAIHLMGLTRRLADLAQANDAATVGAAIADHNRAELRRYIARSRRWLTAVVANIGGE